MDQINGKSAIQGMVCAGRVYPAGRTPVRCDKLGTIWLPGCWAENTPFEPNLTLYDWGEINGELLRGAPDGRDYRIAGMYIEFENNGGAAVSPPTFDRSGGKSYYDALGDSATRDYLRVPMTAATLADAGNGPGKLLTFFAQTTGVVGVHGKAFNDIAQSRVFGAALVAFPVEGDATQDILHSRFYYSAANQLVKQAGSQISVTWPLTLN